MTLSWEWTWETSAAPEVVWPLVSDTQRVNRAVGLPPWHFSNELDPRGGSKRTGRVTLFGIDVSWDEHPFEWRAPHEFAVERRYHNGPLSRLVSHTRLEPRPDGGTRLTQRVEADPRGPFGTLFAHWQVGVLSRRGFNRVIPRLLKWAERPHGDAFTEPPPVLAPGVGERVDRIAQTLAQRHPQELVKRLVAHVTTAADPELMRMRPFALARRWGVDRRALLRLCLQATREGLLGLSWDALCPHCRGSKGRTESLSRLHASNHCDSCNVGFEIDFARTVEVTFHPAPAIRAVELVDYCIGGPGNSPHVVAQRRLASGAREELSLALPAGTYRARSPHSGGELRLVVEPGGAPTAAWSIVTEGTGEERTVGPAFQLTLANDTAGEALVVLERTAWLDDAATADVVTTEQEFRGLFSAEVLATDERIRVGQLAFLFTDLKDSTAMYERVGDATAFSVVRDHFAVLTEVVASSNGAVVKTIGDAVMAVFADPRDAVRAADAMFAALRPLATPHHPLVLKVGLHAGPCIAVTLNERLDYFGTTVNLAARVQAESTGGDVVMTRSFADDPAVAAFLHARSPARQPFQRGLKGISGEVELVRVQFDVAAGQRDSA